MLCVVGTRTWYRYITVMDKAPVSTGDPYGPDVTFAGGTLTVECGKLIKLKSFTSPCKGSLCPTMAFTGAMTMFGCEGSEVTFSPKLCNVQPGWDLYVSSGSVSVMAGCQYCRQHARLLLNSS